MIIYSMAFYIRFILWYIGFCIYICFGGVFGLEAFYSLRFSRIGIGVLVLYVFIRGLEAFYLDWVRKLGFKFRCLSTSFSSESV